MREPPPTLGPLTRIKGIAELVTIVVFAVDFVESWFSFCRVFDLLDFGRNAFADKLDAFRLHEFAHAIGHVLIETAQEDGTHLGKERGG